VSRQAKQFEEIMPNNTSSALTRIDRLMREARSSMHSDVPSQLIQMFVLVALNEGKSLTEIAEIAGSKLSTASRHMLDLGDRNRKKLPGYGLVASRQDPMSLRTNIYTLTPKGRLFAERLADVISV
jgi:DNA-binding MarR family transcriptional regulator